MKCLKMAFQCLSMPDELKKCYVFHENLDKFSKKEITLGNLIFGIIGLENGGKCRRLKVYLLVGMFFENAIYVVSRELKKKINNHSICRIC